MITSSNFLSRATLLSQSPALRHINRKMPKINTLDALGGAIQYTQDTPKICPKRAHDIPKISPRYAEDMPKICPGYRQISNTLITHLINLNIVSRDASASKNMWWVLNKFMGHDICFEFVSTFQCLSMTNKYRWKDKSLLLLDLATKCQSEQHILLEISISALTPPKNNHK